jgi:hypothetical protein
MPTVSAGSSAIVDVAIGQKIAVSTTGEAYVDIVSGTLGAGYTSKRLAGNILSQTFGPYGMETQLNIRAIDGTATYGPAATETTGGATEFTQLADAPAAIKPNSIVAGNNSGTSLECKVNVKLEDLQSADHPVARSQINLVAFGENYDNPEADAVLYANSGNGRGTGVLDLIGVTNTGGFANFTISADSNDAVADSATVIFHLSGNTAFEMDGFDAVASSDVCNISVDGTVLPVTKAIKVNIAGQVFYWPLFGPVV